ncbi:MAG TPA: hypothetical protein VFC10_17485 [Terriglobia bacterium]|nr:hypothetical protein [Terriglobia bacterium]
MTGNEPHDLIGHHVARLAGGPQNFNQNRRLRKLEQQAAVVESEDFGIWLRYGGPLLLDGRLPPPLGQVGKIIDP